MRGLLWVVALAALAIGITLLARYNTGYVLLVLQDYRAELSLNLAVVLLAGAFIAFYLLLRLLVHTLTLPARVREYRLRRRRQKSHNLMASALSAFLQGRYGRAEKAAAAALKLGESPAVNAVVAARCAHQLRETDKRDAYLDQIAASQPDERMLKDLTRAEFLLESRDHPGALTLLQSLRSGMKRPPVALLKLLLKAQQRVKNWDAVIGLLAELRKRDAMEPAQIEQLKRFAHAENLQLKASNPQGLRDYWDSLPGADQADSGIALTAARIFMELGDCRLAHGILETSLEQEWNSELVALYSECPERETVRQIERAEKWLPRHPDDAALLLTLGKLCAHAGLWGKAQSYIEASLSVEPGYAGYLALAQLHEKLNQGEAARVSYRKSLELAIEQLRSASGGRWRGSL